MNLQDLIPRLFGKFIYAAILCFGAGVVSAFAMAPTNFWFLLFICLPLFYLALVHAKSKRAAFAYGWLFAFGYFTVGLYWIGNALLVEGNPYKWAWPLAVAGLPAFLSLYWGIAAVLLHRFIALRCFTGWLAFSGAFTLAEWLRGHVFTGFPWNQLGYTWADHLEIVQIVGLTDVYALSLLTFLWASCLVLLVVGEKKDIRYAGALSIVSFALVHGYGLYVLANYADMPRDDVNIRIVQPNIDQAEKWDRDKMAEHFMRQIELSTNSEEVNKPTYIIWPETAFSFRYANDPAALSWIRQMLETYPANATLMTGMLRYEPDGNFFTNSLVTINKNTEIQNVYSKSHLVPFGEYIPFQKYIPLKPIVRFSGFRAGGGAQTYSTEEGLTYSPLICYEIIFPHKTFNEGQPRPDFIVNVTNDAWYGISPGPYQHFVQTQFRAIESGVPVIRAANTGFSGIVTPLGHVIHKTELMQRDAVNVELTFPSTRFMPSNTLKTAFFFLAIFCSLLPAIARRLVFISKN